jgi:ABC-type multidrug transport system permease subunit
MMVGAIFWREWIGFRNKALSNTLSSLVSPLLYLVAFGWGLGDALTVQGMSYTSFVMPGILAMGTMISAFSIIANDVNMARIYSKTFEAVMISPVRMPAYVLARLSAHVLRCLYQAALIVLLSFLFRARIRIDGYFALVLILNCYVFSALGFLAGILINTHADVAKVSAFVITPMSFLCGTFFPLEKFPAALRVFVSFLPLSQTVTALRQGFAAAGWTPLLVLALWLAALFLPAVHFCEKAE